MQKILFVVPSLAYGGTSTRVLLLATGLPRSQFELRVAVLGEAGPGAAALRAQGIDVLELGWRRPLDLRPLQRLHALVRAFRPDIVHAWERPAVRAVAAVGTGASGRLLASRLPTEEHSAGGWGLLDAWLRSQVDVVIADGPGEANRYRQQRWAARRVVCIPPGVARLADPGPRGAFFQALGIPEGARLVLGVGPFVRGKGFREAIWAFDILRYLDDEMHLVLVGEGPERAALQRFTCLIGADDRVHFLGNQAELAPFLHHAWAVWVPSRQRGGVQVALEALAAGRPVVATRLPALAAVLRDGETALLVDPGDPIALARKGRQLLHDPERSRRLGEAGRQEVARRFSAAAFVSQVAALYQGQEAALAIA